MKVEQQYNVLYSLKGPQARLPKKLQRRRRLRRLGSSYINEPNLETNRMKAMAMFRALLKRRMRSALMLTVAVAVLVALHYSNNPKAANMLSDFFNSYRRQYNQIIYGHCGHQLDTQLLFTHMRGQQILHQEQALQQLEVALRNDSQINAIAIVGPPGVGKSMWVRALQQHFPWTENVHSYVWNTYVRDEVEKFHILRMFIENFSDCGRNLLVIDNLTPCDREVVTIINKLIAEELKQSKSEKYVVIVYVFNMNTMETEGIYNQKFEMLQQLPQTKTINFKPFGVEELKDCIKREALIANMTLSCENFDEIVATIDATRSGCKNVQAKVLTFGESTDSMTV